MRTALPMVVVAAEPTAEWAAGHVPPEVDLRPYTARELYELFRGGEPEADRCERLLVASARERAGIDLAIGEGLAALRKGERLAELGYHLDDYAREVLDLDRRTADGLAHLAIELRTRPLLREAVASGRVRLRAAQAVLPVAKGDAEAAWVERAERETVRALEAAVRSARSCLDGPVLSSSKDPARAGLEGRADGAGSCSSVSSAHPEPEEAGSARRRGEGGARAILERGAVGPSPGSRADDDGWRRFSGWLAPEDRRILDEGLALAGEVLQSGGRLERLEALAQEYLSAHPCEEESEAALLQCTARVGPRPEPGTAMREAALEAETDRWFHLPEPRACPAPESGFDRLFTAEAIDARLRELAGLRRVWDEIVGHCACAVLRSGMHRLLGFGSFRQYVRERLGLPARAVEQRARLEARIWASPALQEAREQKLPYEKLRLLSRLPEARLGAWLPRARALTCVELGRRIDAELQGQLCAERRMRVALPRSLAVTVAAAIHAARRVAGGLIPVGRCLAMMAQHFLDTWKEAARRWRSRSRRVRRRDQGQCQVPGCSHEAGHAHHVVPRARGGSDDPSNLVAVCPFHHLRCIHGGFLRVWGRAPDALVWLRAGKPWVSGR